MNDTGNFFLRDASNESKILWQSFDSPNTHLVAWSQPKQTWLTSPQEGAFVFGPNQGSNVSCFVAGFAEKSPNDWGPNNYSSGCERRIPLTCENNVSSNGAKDKFLVFSSTVLPENPMKCLPRLMQHVNWSLESATSWMMVIVLHIQSLLGLAASELPSNIVVRSCFLGDNEEEEGSVICTIVTKNFSEKLGGGGFGSVFKGTLPYSTVIAVKKLESISQGENISEQRFCSEGTEKLLVYDYMPNGFLDTHFSMERRVQMSWTGRQDFKLHWGLPEGWLICMRSAGLHHTLRHKARKYLPDANFCPKVADFA
ncbi:hypothetical protein RJ641_017372 [Dillenia turbinata]|uniref:Uncharacterized protein n=1 Tax=Dillenia turbinata TaxID=194707 RepID=A0AAN8UNW5_9MAGN